MTHIFFNENEVAEILGIEPDQIGFAIRRGDLCLPDAIGIHGLRLWSLNTLMLNPRVQMRIPDLGMRFPRLTHELMKQIDDAWGRAPREYVEPPPKGESLWY